MIIKGPFDVHSGDCAWNNPEYALIVKVIIRPLPIRCTVIQ